MVPIASLYAICTLLVQYLYVYKAYKYCTYTVQVLYNGRRGWGVESGKWRVESGEWKVESGKWRVESGEWKVLVIVLLCYCVNALVFAV